MLGDVLVRRNRDSLNAGPGVWIAFNGDNGDIKFTQKFPILPETHEAIGTAEERKACCESRHLIDMLFDLQARQAAQAGYCGGYQTKVQPIGKRELARFHQAFTRKMERLAHEPQKAASEQFKAHSKRLFQDMESKGTIRTVGKHELSRVRRPFGPFDGRMPADLFECHLPGRDILEPLVDCDGFDGRKVSESRNASCHHPRMTKWKK
jgi:hypothetical protein